MDFFHQEKLDNRSSFFGQKPFKKDLGYFPRVPLNVKSFYFSKSDAVFFYPTLPISA